MQGGFEQQIPPQAAVIKFGFPFLSYVPITHAGAGRDRVLAPKDFFIDVIYVESTKIHYI
jgi:hypothetical protein